MKLRLGTRGSALALAQAEMTEAALKVACPEVEIERVIIKTTGDRRTDVALKDVAATEEIVDKGVFIKELEIALENGEIDFAVHSLKDVPTVLEDQFELVCFLERAATEDVLVTKTPGGLDLLGPGVTVGTSSVRRARQLTYLRPAIKTADIRGNVPTRLEKLATSENYDAIMLARAGLDRLDYDCGSGFEIEGVPLHVHTLDPLVFFPAAGQGAVAMEVRAGDEKVSDVLTKISHSETEQRVRAEREFLRLLDAGCHTPVGVWSTIKDGVIQLGGRVFAEDDDGAEPRHATAEASDALTAGKALFNALR